MDNIDTNSVQQQDEKFFFQSEHGHNLYMKIWNIQKKNIRCLVFICHGFGEHCVVYADIAEKFTENEFLVFAHDHVGHGASEGTRVDISSFDIYVDDVIQNVTEFKLKYPGIPCFIFAHSMGGTIAILAAHRSPKLFTGVILISPAILEDKHTATPVKCFVAKIASFLAPQLQVGKIEPTWISRDPNVGLRYENDPLIWHGGLKARQAMNMLHSMREIQANLSDISFPFIIFHGTDDKLCHIDGSKLMLDKAKSVDKALKIYEGAYHAIHKEIDGVAEDCIQFTIEWISKHL